MGLRRSGGIAGFATARLFDDLDPIEKQKNAIMRERGMQGGRAEIKALRESEQQGHRLCWPCAPTIPREPELEADPLVQFVLKDAEANVLCPATKLWNTGHGANVMREAVSLMGGYGITEDCPGFLASKWMDAQLEATYEGPEAVQRRQLTVTMTGEVFLAQFRAWTAEMRRIASTHPGTGACTLASAMQMWLWTLNHLQKATDAAGNKLYHGQRQGVTFPMADALCWLLASRCQILDVLELEERGAGDPVARRKSCPARSSSSATCAMCRRRRPRAKWAASARSWSSATTSIRRGTKKAQQRCFSACELDELEQTMPGISAFAVDVVGDDGSHPQKAGPCAGCEGASEFLQIAEQALALPERLAPGQGPRRRNRQQGHDS